MRGKAKLAVESSACCRITPAYAGKSVERKGENPFDLDHPRLCGEKQLPFGFLLLLPGSPPPMRGKGILHGICGIGIRITPAYAGKSLKITRLSV